MQYRKYLGGGEFEQAIPYRTQKARGCSELVKMYAHGSLPYADAGSLRAEALQKCEVFPHAVYQKMPAFGRPCPMMPRHGFVDSRKVETTADALKLVAETLQADPGGEVMFGPLLDGKWSAIINNAGVSIGGGNDGATSGKGALLIPSPCAPSTLLYATPTDTVSEAPFYEIVGNGDNAEIVQMRDGPAIPGTADYIPTKLRVGRIMQTRDTLGRDVDLLQWEAAIKAASPDTVVFAPGSTLASHYAVHAIVRGLPVITSRDTPPDIGEEIEAVSEDNTLTKDTLHYIARQMRMALRIPTGTPLLGRDLSGTPIAAITAVAALQASPSWGNAEHTARIAAWAAVTVARYISAACIGEARHYYGSGPGRYDSDKRSLVFPNKRDVDGNDGPRLSRVSVYKKAFRMSAVELEGKVQGCISDFDGRWRGSMGGAKWRNVSEAAHNLLKTIFRFMAKPTGLRYRTMIMAANTAINTAHNGGPILTKWCSERMLAQASVTPAFTLANEITAALALSPNAIETNATLPE